MTTRILTDEHDDSIHLSRESEGKMGWGLLNDDHTSDDSLIDVDILKVSVVTILKSTCEKSNMYVMWKQEMCKECK